MKITYYGTAAAEGFPALFCNCDFCAEARRLGGKNIRSRSQAIIDGELLIDIPADTYMHFLTHGIEGDLIRYLFITHPHYDHFEPVNLQFRYGCNAHKLRVPMLELYGGIGVADSLPTVDESKNIAVHMIAPFETVTVGDYTVTALPARHMPNALFYLIESNGKAILYAHDTGYFREEVFEFLSERKVSIDLLSMDCTNVDIPISDEGSHMGFPNIERLIERLTSLGCVDQSTVKIVNHFSHNGNPLHAHLEERAAAYGCLVSYDGMTVEI